MVSGVDEPTLDALTRYGRHLGMCFQVVDDVLDLTATDEALGKPAGQDLLEGIYTLPVIYALADDSGLRDLLGRPLDTRAPRRGARAGDRNGRWTPRSRSRATTRRRPARRSPAPTSLDAEVTAGLRRLVDGLVDRDS